MKWLILNSDMNVENVNWFEVGKYLAVMMTREEIIEVGLDNVVPTSTTYRAGVRDCLANIVELMLNKGSGMATPSMFCLF